MPPFPRSTPLRPKPADAIDRRPDPATVASVPANDLTDAETAWRRQAFYQGVHHRNWAKGRRLDDALNLLAEMGLKHSDDVYRGRDGRHYQMTEAAREAPEMTELRRHYLLREPVDKGSAWVAMEHATEKALPHALAWMARNDRAPANENRPIAATKAATEPPAPTPKSAMQQAAIGRSGHMTEAERTAATDKTRLFVSGATAGYADNVAAAIKALGASASGADLDQAYRDSLAAEQVRTEMARRRSGVQGAFIEAAPTVIPGVGDVIGAITDARMYWDDPSSRTWTNASLSALGLLPFVPATAGTIKRVGKALGDEAAEIAKKAGKAEADSASTKSTFSKNYPKTFFTANPELKGHVNVHRGIERQSLDKYPGIVDEVEIYSLENLRGVPKELNTKLHLKLIRREWDKFYRENPTTTIEQLRKKCADIDRDLGHQFKPSRGKKP